MASSSRIYKNQSGDMLVPNNIDGYMNEMNFFNSGKLIAIFLTAFADFSVFLWMQDIQSGWVFKLLITLLVIYINTIVLRYVVLEESYYYKMYKKMQKYEITTADLFWDIVGIRDTEDGAICIYSDLKNAVMVKLERGTTVGKSAEAKENYYDSVSNFYKELNLRNLSYIHLNIMEPASKDPRLSELDELQKKSKHNASLNKLVEESTAYMKRVTRSALFETDYYLVYTYNSNRTDVLISDVCECCESLSPNAYASYSILHKKELVELQREQMGIKFFDYSKAMLRVYANTNNTSLTDAFTIKAINYSGNDNKQITVDAQGNARLNRLKDLLEDGTIEKDSWSVKDVLQGHLRKSSVVADSLETMTNKTKELSSEASMSGLDLDTLLGVSVEGHTEEYYREEEKEVNKNINKSNNSKQDTKLKEPKAVEDIEDETDELIDF
mgnify:FL=1